MKPVNAWAVTGPLALKTLAHYDVVGTKRQLYPIARCRRVAQAIAQGWELRYTHCRVVRVEIREVAMKPRKATR